MRRAYIIILTQWELTVVTDKTRVADWRILTPGAGGNSDHLGGWTTVAFFVS